MYQQQTPNHIMLTVVSWWTVLQHIFVEDWLGYGWVKVNGKAVPLQAWSGSECFWKLRSPDFMKTAQDGGKVVSPMHRPPVPPGNATGTTSVRGWVDPRAIVRSKGFYVNEKSTETSWEFFLFIYDYGTVAHNCSLRNVSESMNRVRCW